MQVAQPPVLPPAAPEAASILWWQIDIPLGDAPLWIGALASAVAAETGCSGTLTRRALANPDVPLSTRVAWRVDRAIFGPARALAPGASDPMSGSTSTSTCTSTSQRPGGLIVRLADAADPASTSFQLTLTVGGLPACRMIEAVEQALSCGHGSLVVGAQWQAPNAELISAPRPAKADRPPGGSRQVAEPHFLESVSWQCFVDERSRCRSLDFVADKLVRLAALMVRRCGSVHNQMPLAVPPGNQRLVAEAPLRRALRHAVRRLLAHDQWAITVHQGVAADVLWPDSAGIDLIPPADRFWADPFVLRQGARLWVFFEDLPYATQRGHIACVAIDADGEVSEPIAVLEAPCHLSYPQVFAHQGQWFMLPESSARRNLVLYRARQLPGPWEPVAELLTQVRMADATLHHDGARWWITASVATDAGCIYDELHLYSADRLEGPWRASPHNPVRVDPAWSRPAGPWFVWQGLAARPVQDCRGRYGRALQILTVMGIGDDGVRERPVASLAARAGGLATGVHTYSRVGSDLAIDWVRWRTRLLSPRAGSQQQVGLAAAGDGLAARR